MRYEHGYYAVCKGWFDIWSAPFDNLEDANASRKASIDMGTALSSELRVVYLQENPPEGLPTHGKRENTKMITDTKAINDYAAKYMSMLAMIENISEFLSTMPAPDEDGEESSND